jgi:putative type I restriction/modification system DNA specificity protein
MLLTTIGEAFEINPQVRIPKGTEVPFVTMDQVVPGQRNVSAAENRVFKGGSKFEHGDTLMARITPCLENKKIAQYLPPNHASPSAGSTEFIVIRGKNGVSITPFAYYFVQSPDIHELAISLMTGTSGRQRVDTEAFRMSEIWLPNLTIQEKIVKVLGSLDDKIAVNNRIIETADCLVDALYHQVKKLPPNSTFGEEFEIYGGTTPSTKNDEFWGGDIFWATPTDITALNGPWLLNTSRTITHSGLKATSSILHPENAILMTSRATIGKTALASTPITTNQGFIVIHAPKDLVPWLFSQLRNRTHEFESWANGATFLELPRGVFKTLPFIRCDKDQLAKFNATAWPLLKHIEATQQENQTLARTRDELLPLLMNGKITVRDAEEASAEVGVDKHEVEE